MGEGGPLEGQPAPEGHLDDLHGDPDYEVLAMRPCGHAAIRASALAHYSGEAALLHSYSCSHNQQDQSESTQALKFLGHVLHEVQYYSVLLNSRLHTHDTEG